MERDPKKGPQEKEEEEPQGVHHTHQCSIICASGCGLSPPKNHGWQPP